MKNVREHQYRKSYVVECGKLTSNLVRSFNCTITLQEVYVREGFHLNDGQKLFFFQVNWKMHGFYQLATGIIPILYDGMGY